MKQQRGIQPIAAFMIAVSVLAACASSPSEHMSAAQTYDVVETTDEDRTSTLFGFDEPLSERNPAQQFAAGFLAVPAIALYLVMLPFML